MDFPATFVGHTLIGQGSSKDLYRADAHPGHVVFRFSDRVSVFDYGALPERIPHKGATMERQAKAFFTLLESQGLRTAYDPAVSEKLGACALHAARHPKFPAASDANAKLVFIPLEIIFRWGVTPGSSLLKRRPELAPYTEFAEPIIEFSTKLEASDRIVDAAEAAQLAGSAEVLQAVTAYARRTAEVLRARLQECGLRLWDGKIECAWDEVKKQVVFIDALTLDELRVSVPGLETVPFSKELLRHWLGGTPWAFDITRAKLARGDRWREFVGSPPRLGPYRTQKFAELYSAFAETLEQGQAGSMIAWARTDRVKPRVCLMGQGGRETALTWRLQKEGCEMVASPDQADVTWVSPDAELAAGRVDELRAQGHWTWGPVRDAARIEWSKTFGKEIARRAGIRLPRFSEEPIRDLREFPEPPVVKLDGLAAGKGVIVPETWQAAAAAVDELSARGKVVLEERCRGFEASAFFAVEAGVGAVKTKFLGTARDFKRRFAGDEGPNTGGMGAHAPHPLVTDEDIALFAEWARRTGEVLAEDGIPFTGIVYLGCLKDETKGWVLLEYNARFGDPETQALVVAWPEDRNVLRPLLKIDIRTESPPPELRQAALCVAMVRHEYPASAPPIDLPAWGFDENFECVLFRSGSLSGRVAYVVGRGPTLLEAGDAAFGRLVESPWKSLLDWRTDIL
jgi:phosphoribosylaminoimidazole-succinocarboxamide synthase